MKKSRENLDSNHFNVTVSVPIGHNAPVNEELVLKSAINGATKRIPISFTPTQPTKKPASTTATTREEQTQATYDMDTKTRDLSKADEQGSQITQYLVAIFLLAISVMAVCGSNDMQLAKIIAGFINLILKLVGLDRGRDRGQDLSRSYYSATDLASRSFGNRSLQNYSLVRDTNKNRVQMMSPERYHSRPADGAAYSRGSVVSPQSMNQHHGPQNVRDSVFMRLNDNGN